MSEAVVPDYKGMVLYTDGGCVNNNVGWGFHGYYYSNEKPKKGSGHPSHTLTNAGYYQKSDKKEEVTPIKYLDGFGSKKEPGTNNVAELLGATNAFNKAMEYDIKTLRIKTDSEYVRKGILEWSPHWVRNNWIKQDGSPVPNKEYWKELLTSVKTIKDKNVNVTIEWVKGHNDIFGNVAADKLATVGVMNSAQGHFVTSINESEPDGYWKSEVFKHPFLFNKRFYFNTLSSSHVPGEYLLGDHGKDDELLGQRDGDGAYSVTQFKAPEPIMEMIRQYQTEMSGDFDSIVMVRLDKLFNYKTYKEIEGYGKAALIRSRATRLDLDALDKEPLTKELKPPRLAWRAIECLSILKALLTNYRSGTSQELQITDITSVFYEDEVTEKKKVVTTTKKLKAEFIVGFSKLTVEAKIFSAGVCSTSPITLVMGQDIADRNSLKRLETLEPKVLVLTWTDAPGVFKYATVIESKGDYLISAGMYSNTIYRQL